MKKNIWDYYLPVPLSRPEIYSFDHVYPTPLLSGSQSPQLLLPVAILYCQWGTESCLHWHHQLAGLASLGSLRYVFRHHFQVSLHINNSVCSRFGLVCVMHHYTICSSPSVFYLFSSTLISFLPYCNSRLQCVGQFFLPKPFAVHDNHTCNVFDL